MLHNLKHDPFLKNLLAPLYFPEGIFKALLYGYWPHKFCCNHHINLTKSNSGAKAKDLQRTGLHIWTSHVKRNSDIKLIRHGLPFHQSKLPNMIAMVCCIYYISIVQFTCFSQCIINLEKKKSVTFFSLNNPKRIACKISEDGHYFKCLNESS